LCRRREIATGIRALPLRAARARDIKITEILEIGLGIQIKYAAKFSAALKRKQQLERHDDDDDGGDGADNGGPIARP